MDIVKISKGFHLEPQGLALGPDLHCYGLLPRHGSRSAMLLTLGTTKSQQLLFGNSCSAQVQLCNKEVMMEEKGSNGGAVLMAPRTNKG